MITELQSSRIERALVFSAACHKGQQRKFTGQPYIFHPIRVANSMTEFGESHIIVALLHDVLEDTDANHYWDNLVDEHYLTLDNEIDFTISEEEYLAIIALTRNEGETYNDYIARCAENEIAREVKIADLHDNMRDLPIDVSPGSMYMRYNRALDTLFGVMEHQETK